MLLTFHSIELKISYFCSVRPSIERRRVRKEKLDQFHVINRIRIQILMQIADIDRECLDDFGVVEIPKIFHVHSYNYDD